MTTASGERSRSSCCQDPHQYYGSRLKCLQIGLPGRDPEEGLGAVTAARGGAVVGGKMTEAQLGEEADLAAGLRAGGVAVILARGVFGLFL